MFLSKYVTITYDYAVRILALSISLKLVKNEIPELRMTNIIETQLGKSCYKKCV